MVTPTQVAEAVKRFKKGEISFEEVKTLATGVQYAKREPSPWGDISLNPETFEDTITVLIGGPFKPAMVNELFRLGKHV